MSDKLGEAMPGQWTVSLMRVWTINFRLKSFAFENVQRKTSSLIPCTVTFEVNGTTNGKNNGNDLLVWEWVWCRNKVKLLLWSWLRNASTSYTVQLFYFSFVACLCQDLPTSFSHFIRNSWRVKNKNPCLKALNVELISPFFFPFLILAFLVLSFLWVYFHNYKEFGDNTYFVETPSAIPNGLFT